MIKFGTVGTNWITESFITGAVATGKWELGGVYSRDIEKAKILGTQSRCSAHFDDMGALAGSGIEAVYIASPNSLHFQQILFFLERGLHVICEKPMVVNRRQYEEAYALADKKGVYLIEAFRHINSPGFGILKEKLGMIGPIRNAIFSYVQYSSRYESYKRGENPNIFNPSFYGGGLMDIGVYPISLAVALWGRPLDHRFMAVRLENGVDATGSLILHYGSFLCTLSYSKLAEGAIENEIAGEEGCLTIDKPAELTRITLRKKDGKPMEYCPPPQPNKLQGEADVFADIIENGAKGRYKELVEISRMTNELLEALY